MDLGVIISNNYPETVWNAFRIANLALNQKDSVSIYLIGDGVDAAHIGNEKFNIKEQMSLFIKNSGKLKACTSCMNSRNISDHEFCPAGTLADLYDIIKSSDKLITF